MSTSMLNTSILIVTNEIKEAHDLREYLLKLGYRVVGIASSNDEIISKIDESKPDLILTDIQMKGGGGGISPYHYGPI